jgi:hypothetical protein
MAGTSASEELLAAPLPAFIRDLGLAVAEANKALHDADGDVRFAIPEAEVEINVAISISRAADVSVGASLGLQAFSVNAAYKSTFGYKEEASSRIRLKVQAVPATTAEE